MAILIGILSGFVCYLAVELKDRLHWDDALDVWGVRGVGGVLGTICLGLFGSTLVNEAGSNGLLFGGRTFFFKQVAAALGAAAYGFLFTYVMLWLMNKVMRVRMTKEQEEQGLDESLHGETAYV